MAAAIHVSDETGNRLLPPFGGSFDFGPKGRFQGDAGSVPCQGHRSLEQKRSLCAHGNT